ncbi:MAG: pentapeptide repeat-containing protein [Armatimonadetes bacterium]|nr:pentapeptide repeat-containing protein [Armatimonadota bacterium]
MADKTILRNRFDPAKSKEIDSLDLSALPAIERSLSELDFGTTDCRDANFHDADLSFSDLSKVTNLSVDMLAGANLSGANLPAALPLDSFVSRVDDRIKDTGKFFLVLLGADAYSLLTLFSTKSLDLKLITNSADAVLPVLNISISIVNFCLITPLILTGGYIYYLLELQRLWEELARLPMLFPDKRKVHERVYPWFVTFLVSRRSPHYQKMETGSRVFAFVQNTLLILLTWAATPLTIVYFGLNMVKTRNSGQLYTLEILLTLCLTWGITTYTATIRGLKHSKRPETVVSPAPPAKKRRVSSRREVATLLAYLAVLFFAIDKLTYGLVDGVPLYSENRLEGHKQIPTYDVRVWARQLTRPLEVIGYSAFPNLKGMEVSTKLTPPVSATIANSIWDWEQQEADFLKQYAIKTEEVKSLAAKLYEIAPASKEYETKRSKLSIEIEKVKAQQDILLQNYLGRVKRADLRNAKLRYLDAERAFLVGANVAGADMRRAQLQEANLIGLRGGSLGMEGEVNYVKPVDFEQASLWHANLIGANLIRANLNRAYLNGANLIRANLTGANLNRADLNGANLIRANLNDAHLNGAHLDGAYLNGAYLNGAYLTGAYLNAAYLNGAHLTDAHLTDANLIRANLNGAHLNAAHLNGAHLDGAYLNGAYLNAAYLNAAYLNGAHLTDANLTDADLNAAYLSSADLTGADLNAAYLSSADLTGADLNDADLSSADLNDADLSSANLKGAHLSSADLTGAKGITKKQILEAKWREVPKGLPPEWKLTPKQNWTQDDEENWKSFHPNGF